MSILLAVDDTTFRRCVLAAPLPVLVCFHAPGCVASAALLPMLGQLAPRYAGRLMFAEIDADANVAEQYGVAVSPSLLVFRYGNEVLRSPGFLPARLLALLCDDAVEADTDYPRLWTPLEERFEEAALLPLLDTLELRYERQHQIVNWPKSARSGRIDLLVHDAAGLVTVIESKRALRGEIDLRAAARQAHSYARAMGTRSFVVAAPAGMWVYACHGAHALLDHAFTWLDLHDSVEPLADALHALRTPM